MHRYRRFHRHDKGAFKMSNDVKTTAAVQHIYPALAAVQRELAQLGVGKDHKNRDQGFMFRAWDDVQQAVSLALSKHEIIGPLVDVIDRHDSDFRTKSGGLMRRVILRGTVRFVSGKDGSHVQYVYEGEGMDMGDKATSKALTMLVKFALIHGLSIPVKGVPDPDSETPEEAAVSIDEKTLMKLNEICDELLVDKAAFCKYLRVDSLADLDEEGAKRAFAALEKKRKQIDETA